MSDASDMETIIALLGNLIERIEEIEKQQTAQAKVLMMLKDHLEDRDEKYRALLGSLSERFKGTMEKLDKLTHHYEMNTRNLSSDDVNARRHGEINEWTGDLSRKLSEMQITLDRMEKKKGIFG